MCDSLTSLSITTAVASELSLIMRLNRPLSLSRERVYSTLSGFVTVRSISNPSLAVLRTVPVPTKKGVSQTLHPGYSTEIGVLYPYQLAALRPRKQFSSKDSETLGETKKNEKLQGDKKPQDAGELASCEPLPPF